ncbi:MAG: c-type cytochrome [Thermoanaerobaculia bacterium]
MSTRAKRILCLAVLAAGVLGGCRQDMHDQPRLEPLEASGFFDDGRGSRAPVEGTVARGMLREDAALYRGLDASGAPVAEIPVEVDLETLERGRFLFDGFCAPCHDRAGTGNGMVVQRGFKQPPSMHETRLREAPPGYVFGIISNGFGQMSSYAAQIEAEDRWAVAAYIRALQLSQDAAVTDLTADERRRLEQAAAADAAMEGEPAHGEGEDVH